jgi:glycosyltransferase involved in cell wall biosynthesis
MTSVSVILPTYNRADLLMRAIQSVLCQTFRDFELVVVDDASDDHTDNIVAQYSDERLQYVRHAERRGAAAARNTGIRVSQGAYIAFQDSDDEWLPEKLAQQMDVFAQSDAHTGVVYCRFQHVHAERVSCNPSMMRIVISHLLRVSRALRGDLHLALLHGNWITTQTAMVRRTCFERCGAFDTELKRFQDWDLWLRLSRFYQFAYLNKSLVRTYFTADSLSAASDTLVPAFERLIRKHATGTQQGRYLVAQYWYALGSNACHAQQRNQGIYHFIRAIRLCPFNMVYWVAALAALAGLPVYSRIAPLIGVY